MIEFTIDIGQVEEWQVLKDIQELNRMFTKAKSTVVQGGIVLLSRNNTDGNSYKTEEITTETELKIYREKVFKYLD